MALEYYSMHIPLVANELTKSEINGIKKYNLQKEKGIFLFLSTKKKNVFDHTLTLES